VSVVRAELLSPAELDAAIAAAPIVYVPLGSLEFHGPHLPIGLDALNAVGVCVAAAERSGGVVLPVTYQGIGGGHGEYPWSIMMDQPEGLRAHLVATLVRLEEFGVRTGVLFTGHFAPEQLELIDDVAAAWNTSGRSQLHALATGVNRCESAPMPPDHAGAFESSLLHSIAPELVHLERLPPMAEHPAVDPGGDAYGLHRHDADQPLWGVFGPDPRPVDLTRSSELLDHLADWLAGLADGGVR
jgi:creatinine amidohydrolase